MSAPSLCVIGPRGRMGRAIVELAAARGGFSLFALDRASGDAGQAGDVEVVHDLDAAMKRADVYIDFSSSSATQVIARSAAAHRVAAVIGTTALTPEAQRALADLSARAPLCVSANFSLGVNLMLLLAERAAAALGDGYDLEVVEIHHKDKRDAPSGTALALAEALARGRGLEAEKALRTTRSGLSDPRPRDQIGVAALRGGSVVGDHTVHFLGAHERLEITHRAGSRHAFADGALRAAAWLQGRPPGSYSMADLLGLAAARSL